MFRLYAHNGLTIHSVALILSGLLVFSGCELASQPPEPVATDFTRAAFLGHRASVIKMLVAEDAELARNNDRFSEWYTGSGLGEIQLLEARNLLEGLVVVEVNKTRKMAEGVEVALTISYPDMVKIFDGMWGTSFGDYIVADNSQKKIIELRLVNELASMSPPMVTEQHIVRLRLENHEWKIVEALAEREKEAQLAEEKARSYKQYILTDTMIVSPKPLSEQFFLAEPVFKNNGSETINYVNFTAYYLSSDGDRIGDVNQPIGYYLKPIKPGYEFKISVLVDQTDSPDSWGGDIELVLDSLELVLDSE